MGIRDSPWAAMKGRQKDGGEEAGDDAAGVCMKQAEVVLGDGGVVVWSERDGAVDPELTSKKQPAGAAADSAMMKQSSS